jgi:hypothetical protein
MFQTTNQNLMGCNRDTETRNKVGNETIHPIHHRKPNGFIVQLEFQDPKMEVLYHIRLYLGGISPYIGLKNRPYIW